MWCFRLKGCCSDDKLCSYHDKYPTLFYYQCAKCKKYEGSSMMGGHKVILDTKCKSAPLPTKEHWLVKTMIMYPDMNIFMAICAECGKCKCCYGEKKKWEQQETVKELEAIL